MRVVAISVDSVADSARMARAYGIEYPLLADADGTVSRAYVGLDDADVSVPGIVIVLADGRVGFRQIARDKADRLSASQLLAVIDGLPPSPGRRVGALGAVAAKHGYAPLERLSLRVDLGGGIARTRSAGAGQAATDTSATAAALGSVWVPMARHLMLGGGVSLDSAQGWVDVGVGAGVRWPLLGDLGTVELLAWPSWALTTTGAAVHTRLGLTYALTPSLSVQLGVGAQLRHEYVDDRADVRSASWTITLGVGQLIAE
mgnify:CR=1 FL=1